MPADKVSIQMNQKNKRKYDETNNNFNSNICFATGLI